VLLNQGQFAAARDSLARILSEVPHHPFVLNEWCHALLALEDWAGVERIAKSERAAQSDSVLLARSLAEAEERLGRPTDAALTAVEGWAASALLGNWADGELRKPMPFDLPRVRDAMRRAVARDATRGDLAAALARLDWRANDLPAMLKSLRAASAPGGGGSPRPMFAEELLQSGAPRDSAAAIEILLDLASDRALPAPRRNDSARRAWTLLEARGGASTGASRLAGAARLRAGGRGRRRDGTRASARGSARRTARASVAGARETRRPIEQRGVSLRRGAVLRRPIRFRSHLVSQGRQRSGRGEDRGGARTRVPDRGCRAA
jgi:hypothetical protein